MTEQGVLVVVSAPSGTGKSTVLHRLMELRESFNLAFSVSATTRLPRQGEKEGVDYFFLSREEFDRMVREDKFLEYADYAGNRYGTPRAAVEAQLARGYDVYLDIEVRGAMQVRSRCPDALMIFLMPPGMEELERRLVSRGTDPPEVIRRRLLEAERELGERDQFDYVVVNESVDNAAREISKLIDRHREARRAASQ